ncbi:helix-turn-helix domain-containing protein [Paenibacillaceae bacterium]|nr:helix-turn-helix domain-containing protein [Paenibacillaceae bacterium]
MDQQTYMQSHTLQFASFRKIGSRGTSKAGNNEEMEPARIVTSPRTDTEQLCSFLLMVEGAGMVDLDGELLFMRNGTGMQIRPGGSFCLKRGDGPTPPCGWLVQFQIFHHGEAAPLAGGFQLLPYHQEIVVRPLAALLLVVQRLAAVSGDGELDALRQQGALCELLALLLESRQQEQRRPEGPADAVKQAIAYVHKHYAQPLTVEQLAGMVGVGRWQFSELFRRLAGEKPLDYINQLRLKRAKELLLLTDDPLRDVAQSVGFKDECYFNRRFTRMYGCSPKAYARSRKQGQKSQAASQPAQPRLVVFGSMLGDVLMLGARPLAASLRIMGQQVVYRDQLQGIRNVEAEDGPETILKLQPDLILFDQEKAHLMANSQGIAPPIVCIGRTEDASVRLRAIAGLLGTAGRAECWLAAHEANIERMWAGLQNIIGQQETASVLVHLRGQLFAMSNQGLGATIYHPHGFCPSTGVRKLMASGKRFISITANELPDYDADRLFVLVSGGEEQQAAVRTWLGQPAWSRLKAFRSGTVHLAEAKWNYDDALTREYLLPMLPEILASRY